MLNKLRYFSKDEFLNFNQKYGKNIVLFSNLKQTKKQLMSDQSVTELSGVPYNFTFLWNFINWEYLTNLPHCLLALSICIKLLSSLFKLVWRRKFVFLLLLFMVQFQFHILECKKDHFVICQSEQLLVLRNKSY